MEFKESGFPYLTWFVRLKIGLEDTDNIIFLDLLQPGLQKNLPDERWEMYARATLINCRSDLDPVLGVHHTFIPVKRITGYLNTCFQGGVCVWLEVNTTLSTTCLLNAGRQKNQVEKPILLTKKFGAS